MFVVAFQDIRHLVKSMSI